MSQCIDPKMRKLIGLYEFQKLSKKERKQFESHLLDCEACFQDVYELLPTAETLRKHRKAFQAALQIKKAPRNVMIFPRPARYVLAFAALICILILPKPFRENMSHLGDIRSIPYWGIKLKGDYQKTAFDYGIIAYERADYTTAVDSLRHTISKDSSNIYAILYCGISYALKDTMPDRKDLANAAFYLEWAIEHAHDFFSESEIAEARWILANVYIKQNSIENAKGQLRLLAERENDYQQISKKILDALQDIRRISLMQVVLEKIKKG